MVYWERQSGGLCRLHSINAFLGLRRYDAAQFAALISEFDTRQKGMYGITTSAADFDMMNSDQINIISYILGTHHNIPTKYVSFGDIGSNIDYAMRAGIFFVFSASHIWIMKKVDGQWYRVDSMGGPRLCSPSSLGGGVVGIIVPIWDARSEFATIMSSIELMVGDDVAAYLRRQNEAKNVMGGLEVLIGRAVAIVEIQCRRSGVGRHMLGLVCEGYEFNRLVSAGKYNDIDLILRWVPHIVACLRAVKYD
jgi:hypothetical protein